MSDFFGSALDFDAFDRMLSKDDLIEEPIPVDRFVTDSKYLGNKSLSDIQIEIVKHSTQIFKPSTLVQLYGEEKGLQYYNDYTVKEVVAQLGKGSGKDHTARISMAYIAYLLHCLRDPLDYYGKGHEVTVDLVNVAVNAKQAQQVFFDPLKKLLMSSPYFMEEALFEPRSQEIFFFERPIRLFSGHSESESWEGYEALVFVLDEISAFKADVELGNEIRNKGSASQIYNMARASVQSRFPDFGKVILLSFPRFRGDFIQTRYKSVMDDIPDNQKNMPESLGNKGTDMERSSWVIKAATWEVNPTRKREEFEDELRRDPIQAKARYMSLTSDQKIWTNNGLKNIDEIVAGDNVNTRYGPQDVNFAWAQKDKRSCVEVNTKEGYRLRCSDNHPVFVCSTVYPSRDREKYGRYTGEWKLAGELKPNDIILNHFDNKLFGSMQIDNDTAYLLGLVISDGNFRNDTKRYVQIACGNDKKFAETVSAMMKKSFGGGNINVLSDGQYYVRSSRKDVLGKLCSYMEPRVKAHKKRIPDCVYEFPEEALKSFISGLMDGDGCVSHRLSYVSTSKELLHDIQNLLAGLGLRSNITLNRKASSRGQIKSNYDLFSLNLWHYDAYQMSKWLDLKSYKKQKLNIAPLPEKGKSAEQFIFSRVSSVENIGFHHVYDINVDNVEEFVCNGIVVHNCEPPEMEDAYFRDPELVRKAFTREENPEESDGSFKEWFVGTDNFSRFIHVDLAVKKDRAALAMCHTPGMKKINTYMGVESLPIVKVDLVKSWEAEIGKEIDFARIRDLIIYLARKFDVGLVTFDQYQSVEMIQSLRALGINADMHNVKKLDYDTLSSTIYDGRLVGYWNEILVEHELLKLQILANNKIDHPTSGSKDLADAVAGSVTQCVSNMISESNVDVEIIGLDDLDEDDDDEYIDFSEKLVKDEPADLMPEEVDEWINLL